MQLLLAEVDAATIPR